MSKLVPFNFNSNEIRVIQDENGEPWFIATDIAKVLGYVQTNSMNKIIDNEDKKKHTLLIGGNYINQSLINEAGLYQAIFGSTLPKAKEFQKWVTRDVLPSIRKHGMYAKEELLDNPDLLLDVVTKLKAEKELRLQAEQKIAEDAPKLECYEDIMGSKDLISFGELAKVLGIKGLGRNNLFAKMRDLGVLRLNNEPYQTYVDRGWFKLVETKFTKPNGDVCINLKTMVYQKGIEGVRRLILAEMEGVL